MGTVVRKEAKPCPEILPVRQVTNFLIRGLLFPIPFSPKKNRNLTPRAARALAEKVLDQKIGFVPGPKGAFETIRSSILNNVLVMKHVSGL